MQRIKSELKKLVEKKGKRVKKISEKKGKASESIWKTFLEDQFRDIESAIFSTILEVRVVFNLSNSQRVISPFLFENFLSAIHFTNV